MSGSTKRAHIGRSDGIVRNDVDEPFHFSLTFSLSPFSGKAQCCSTQKHDIGTILIIFQGLVILFVYLDLFVFVCGVFVANKLISMYFSDNRVR